MNIEQEVHGLIGAKKDIDALATKDHARVLIISDSHRHPGIFQNIVKRYGEKCDALIFCGDGIGDLVETIAFSDSDNDLKKSLPSIIAFARGNGDPAFYPLSPSISISVPNRQLLRVNGHNTMIVHGHNEDVYYGMENLGMEMQLTESDIGFYGHTHVACEETDGKYKFVNPGSCARPRSGQPPCFAIATYEKNFVDIAFIKMSFGPDGQSEYKIWNPIY